jgi:hypothetical protein
MEPFACYCHTRIILQAKTNLKRLEGSHEEHVKNTSKLSNDLPCLLEELGRTKKKLDGKAKSVSDATPMAEMRAAIQRDRKENKELNVHLGVPVSNTTGSSKNTHP